MAKKYKGVAQIELTNVKTGETTIQTEENIVTNAIANIMTQNPWGVVNFHSHSNLIKMLSGIMLFDKTINEIVNNSLIRFDPVSWAGDITNTGSQTRRGNINNPACIVTGTGCQLVWEWNTSQGNGTYKCIGLTNPAICDTDDWGNVAFGSPLSYYYCVTTPWNTTHPTYRDLCQGSTAIYDDKKGYFYKPTVSIDGKTITITRVSRPCHKIPVGQANHWNPTTYDLNKGLAGEVYKDYRSITKTVDTSLTFDQTNYNYTNVISVSYYNNTIYMFSIKHNSQTVIITKIDVGGEFTEASVNVTQETVEFQGTSVQVQAGTQSQTATQVKDCVCFNYPYLYLPNSAYSVWKCNITDPQDITLLETEYTKTTRVTREGITLGNYYISNNGYKINLSENKVQDASKSNFISINVAYNAINLIGNEYVRTINNGSSPSTDLSYYDRICVNPYYIATINNVTPFTKTSDHTLKITYTITEVDT